MEGFETRQVIQSAGPSGQQNAPARQLGLTGVSAPRGGDVSRVGQLQRAMAEVVGMGGGAVDAYLAKKEKEDALKASMHHATGKTMQDLDEAGVGAGVKQQYKILDIKSRHNDYFAKAQAEIDSGDYQLTPDQYHEKLFAQNQELLDSIDANDSDQFELLSSMVNDSFTKLSSAHAAKYAVHSQVEAVQSVSNLMYTESKVSGADELTELWDNVDKLEPGLKFEESFEGALDGTIRALEEGNFSAYDAAGGEEGLMERGASSGQLDAVKSAYRAGQTKNAEMSFKEITMRQNAVLKEVQQGVIGLDDAVQDLDSIQEEFRLSPGHTHNMIKQVVHAADKVASQDEKNDILHNSDYQDDMQRLLLKVGWEGLDGKDAVAEVDRIAKKYNTPRELVQENLKSVRAAEQRHRAKAEEMVTEEYNKRDLMRRNLDKATALVGGNFLDFNDSPKEIKRLSLQLKQLEFRDEAIQEAQAAAEENGTALDETIVEEATTRKYLTFLASNPVFDDQLAHRFNLVAQGNPIGQNGKVKQEHLDALNDYQELVEAGMSDRQLGKYLGNAREYITLAAEMGQVAFEPYTSLSEAYEQLNGPASQSFKPVSTPEEIYKNKWSDFKEDLFDEIEPDWFDEGHKAGDIAYDEILTGQVKEAMKASTDMDAWAQDRIESYVKRFPNLKEDAIMTFLKKDIKNWEYVAGTMVKPHNGKSFTTRMGIDDIPGEGRATRAVIAYMNAGKDAIFEQDPDFKEYWKTWVGRVAQDAYESSEGIVTSAAKKAAREDELGFKIPTLGSALLFSNEKFQQIRNNLPNIQIMNRSDGTIRVIPFEDADYTTPLNMGFIFNPKDIGAFYRQEYNKAAD